MPEQPSILNLVKLCRRAADGDISGLHFDDFPTHWALDLTLGDILLSQGEDLALWPEHNQRRYFASLYRWENQNHVRQKLLLFFAQQCIDCIPLKGAWLMAQTDFPRRPMADLDFLVRHQQVDNAHQALVQLGFEHIDVLHSLFHFHRTYRNGEGVTVELHWHLSLNDFNQVNINQVWARAAKDEGVWEMDLHQNACHILYHSAVHYFDRPDRIVDLANLYFAFGSGLQWNEVESIAARWGVLGHVHLSFEMMREVFNAEIENSKIHRSQGKIKELAQVYMEQSSRKALGLSLADRVALADNLLIGFKGVFSPTRVLGGAIDRWT